MRREPLGREPRYGSAETPPVDEVAMLEGVEHVARVDMARAWRAARCPEA